MSDNKVIKLPTIQELYAAKDGMPLLMKESKFYALVNQEPKKEWLKDHPTAKTKDSDGKTVPVKYIPIERVEWLLINIVVRYRVEVKSVQQIANSVVVSVRLHYWDQIHEEWSFHDGVGAAPLQTEQSAGAIEWDKIKSNAVQIGAPAAESYAVKDAAEKIGKIFGRDLNRRDQTNFEAMANKYDNIFANG